MKLPKNLSAAELLALVFEWLYEALAAWKAAQAAGCDGGAVLPTVEANSVGTGSRGGSRGGEAAGDPGIGAGRLSRTESTAAAARCGATLAADRAGLARRDGWARLSVGVLGRLRQAAGATLSISDAGQTQGWTSTRSAAVAGLAHARDAPRCRSIRA